MSIEVKNLGFSYTDRPVLNGVSLKIDKCEIVSLLGQNGAGKTTLFKCMLGFLNCKEGSVSVDGQNIKHMTVKELARKIAYIPQSFNPAFSHSVLDCVLMGYANVLGIFERPSEKQINRALEVLRTLGIENLAYKNCQKISGGERSLMLIARALVQGADTLIMDEPNANLDLVNTIKVMEIIRKLADSGYTVLFSTHDPNLAVTYSTRVVALKQGRLLADVGSSAVNEKLLASLYETEFEKTLGFRVKT